MAKTTSQIVSENKKEQEQYAKLDAARAEIDKKQVDTNAAAKTAAVLNGTSDKLVKTQKTSTSDTKKQKVQQQKDEAEHQKTPAPVKAEHETPSASEMQAEQAKKRLEEYRNSEEKKKNAEKRLQDKYAQQLLYGITDSSEVLYDEDPREKELQAEADYWDNKVKQEADEKLFASNMQEIQNLSGAERTAFENYANNRTFVDPENLEAYKRLKERYGDKLNDLKYTYQRDREEKAAQAVAGYTAGKMDQGGALADTGRNVLSLGANLVGGITGTAGRINEMVNGTGPYQTVARHTYGDIPSVYGQTVRDKTSDQILAGQDLNISDGISGRELGAIAYQGGMGALDTGARLLASGGNPFLAAGMAASQTFSSTVQEAAEKGATPQEAYALATVSAGIEALTEKLPLDNLVSIAKGGANPKMIVNLLLQAGVEIGEEEASLIGTTLAEMAILKEKSDYQQSIQKAVAMGVPYEQAVAEADRALLEEAKQTALVSGFSGLLSAGGAEAGNRLLGGNQSQQETAQQTQTAAETPLQRVTDTVTETITGRPAAASQTSTQQTDTQNRAKPDAMQVQEQSAEGGQIKGTGAAEQNFTGKPAYNATLSAENAQADRATDVRPMELPAQDINGGNISAVTGNVYGSQNTPDDLAAAMEEPVARGDFSYIRISNDQATQRAQQTIENAGSWAEAAKNFRSDVERGNAGAELSARGALLLNHAAEVYEQAKASGDAAATQAAKAEWLSALSDVQRLGTNTAQGLQALKIIRNLMPQDKLEFAKVAVKNMVRDMKLGNDIQIDENLLTEYENATTDEQRNEVIDKIQQNVADQIPSTMLDKWNALRYTNMLGNLKTAERNVLGNVANSAVYRIKDTVKAGIEAIAYKATGGKTERTTSAIVNKKLKAACGAYYDEVKHIVSNGGKYNEGRTSSDSFTQGVMDKRGIFVSDNKILNAAMMPMETYRKITDKLMNNSKFGDEAFGRAAFTRSMAGYLQANGVKPGTDLSKVDSALIEKAMVHAITEAQEATFHDNSALANVMSKLKKDTGFVGEALMPFTKTPANVLTRAEEFSPLGIINTAVMAAQKAAGNTKMADGTGMAAQWAQAGQNITGTDIINSLSKTITGTGIFVLGAALQNAGLLTGGPDEDEDKAAFDSQNGVQNYALTVKLGDKTYTYTMDWLTPVAMPMFMGAQFMKLAGEEDVTFADLEKAFTSIADPMIQMSMMQGINDSLNNIQNAENNLGQFLINSAVNYVMQGLTNTLLGQLEKSTEKTRQTTYVDPESNTPKWLQRALGKASQKTPGWEYRQTEYINARGETEEQPTGAAGLAYNMLSPGYAKEVTSDAVTEEMNRLNDANIEGNVFPKSPDKTITWTDKAGNVHEDYNLTPEEYQTMAKTQGQTEQQIKEELIETSAYKAMTDQQKADVVDIVQNYAQEAGRAAALPDYDGMENWMKDITPENAVDTIIQKAVDRSITGAFDDIADDWKRGNDTAQSVEAMDQAYKNYQALGPIGRKDFYKDASGRVKYFIDAKNAGMKTETFADMYKKYQDIDGKDLSGAQKAQEWSNAMEKAVDNGLMTEKQKDILKKNMVFRYGGVYETLKYDEMIERNVPTDVADEFVRTVEDLKSKSANGKLSTRETYSAVAGFNASESVKDEIMLTYMDDYDPTAKSPDTTELKYQYARQEMGLSAEVFAEAYGINNDGGTWRSRAEKMNRDTGISIDAAYDLIEIFEGRQKAMLINWYNQK